MVGLAAWSGVVAAECTEGSLDYKPTTHEFKYCDDSETWQPLGGGTALGDRITSGTLAVTANSATSIISLSTGDTTWGYFGSGASYLPTIAAGRVSATNISSTYVQLSSATTVLACNAGATGTMRYTSGTMQVCDGSNWGNIGIGVPTGTIAAFEASSCPAGWTEYTPARGRFLRGIDNGAGNDPAGTRAAGNTQGDAAPDITGTLKSGGSVGLLRNNSGNTTGAFSHSASTESNRSGIDSGQTGWLLNFAASNSNAKYGAANEFRPKNVAVTFCQYAGFQSQLQTGVATLASLSDVSIGGASSGQALVFDGASWVPSTTLGGATAASSTGAIQFKVAVGGLGGDGANLFWDDNNNRLGLGTASPSERLDVSGTVQATAYLHASDLRLKSDVETVANPLELIGRLRGVRFTWKEGGATAYGVIAQEVEKVMPEAVAGGAERLKAVDYDQLLGPMIEAIKELRAQSRQMHAEIESLKRKLE